MKTAKELFSEQAKLVLAPYKVRFEDEMYKAFSEFGPQNSVRDAMEYALKGDGKRFRPALVYMVADGLNKGLNVVPVSLAVEYFHTSSLIADDLPCMDNDDFRRGRATTHKVYGESVALLASYALIASGFEQIAKNETNNSDVTRLGILQASHTMGASGLIGGQYYDLFPKDLDKEKLLMILNMKTCALFDLCMTLGWLFGGGKLELLDEVHRAAYHFGMAFQILDDLDDSQKDALANREVNFANRFGFEEAVRTVEESCKAFQHSLELLGLKNTPLSQLASGLEALSQGFK
ncbi:MAG: polyprenyl synthetase family protein [Verrucomicrobia bacterium]|nr:polyprenyl synthetase family protein [Verrucomicrobiota bacterium]MBS0637435.1 polyprenyl synthetase family protein [Verrucomicrobiota bacterium]